MEEAADLYIRAANAYKILRDCKCPDLLFFTSWLPASRAVATALQLKR